MKLRLASLCVLGMFLVALPAIAQQDLYDNGPTNGTIDAWTINFGFIMSDSFTLQSNSQVNGLQFSAWLFPGDVLESVHVSVTSNELGGVTYFDQQVNLTASGCVVNGFDFNVCNETGSFAPFSLNAGTYWLNLDNAIVNTGDPVYWDENDGPSLASATSTGTLPSESFTILGQGSTSTTSTTPEPETVMLFGSGVVGLFSILRRKFLH